MALSALGWIVSDDDVAAAFLEMTGILPGDLPGLAGTRPFQVSVLEFLTSDDTHVLGFTRLHGLEPMAPLTALNRLKGRSGMNWT